MPSLFLKYFSLHTNFSIVLFLYSLYNTTVILDRHCAYPDILIAKFLIYIHRIECRVGIMLGIIPGLYIDILKCTVVIAFNGVIPNCV